MTRAEGLAFIASWHVAECDFACSGSRKGRSRFIRGERRTPLLASKPTCDPDCRQYSCTVRNANAMSFSKASFVTTQRPHAQHKIGHLSPLCRAHGVWWSKWSDIRVVDHEGRCSFFSPVPPPPVSPVPEVETLRTK